MKMQHFGNVFTTIFYLIEAVNSGKSMIHLLSQDKDVFVLLECWLYREEMEGNVQIERGGMTMLGHSI